MEQTYINQWIDFENKALEVVKQSEEQVVVKYCTMPPFAEATCFQLYEDESGRGHYLVKCWHRNDDYQLFEKPDEYIKRLENNLKPTIEEKRGVVEPTEYQTILTRLKSIELPTFANATGDMLEGTYYELTLTGNKVMTYEWWNNLPSEWTRLKEIIDFLEDFNK